jgi:hypothetical protein
VRSPLAMLGVAGGVTLAPAKPPLAVTTARAGPVTLANRAVAAAS